MRIGSTDAAITSFPAQNSAAAVTCARIPEPGSWPAGNISPTGDHRAKELPVPEKMLNDAIERVNKALAGTYRRFEYSIHEGTKDIMVKVIDTETNEVIREIPPEKILDLVAKLWELAGLFVDERR